MSLKIELTDTGITINSIPFSFPLSFNKLIDVVGQKPSRTINPKPFSKGGNTVYVWDEVGIYCYSKNTRRFNIFGLKDREVQSFDILMNKAPRELIFFPKNSFKGELSILGKDISKRRLKLTERTKSLRIYYELSKDKESIIGLSASKCKIPAPPKDKYVVKQIDEPTIEFKDINFKYAIINELMYNKELIKPKFDLHEFVELYDKRLIDLEEEGYNLIPEVVAYFDKLEIPKRLAKEVTEINQDGSTGIYEDLLRFMEGYHDFENIKSSTDIIHFPNIKRAFFAYANENVIDELKSMGIESGDYWDRK